MIKYLLKFVSEKEHAEMLLSGKLFMRPASYYRNLEQGQGDVCEAAVSHDICAYKHTTVPVYCMYAVQDTEIENNSTAVSGRCIDDFKCDSGYVVIIEINEFNEKMKNLNSDGYAVTAQLVDYHKISDEESMELIADNTERNLFIKCPGFSYQKEFRIVVAKQVYPQGSQPINCKIYKLSQAFSPDKAWLVPICSLEQKNGKYIVPLVKR